MPVSYTHLSLVGQLPADENAKAKQKKIRAIQRELPFVHFELNSREDVYKRQAYS